MVDAVVVGLDRDHVVGEGDRLVVVLLKLIDGSIDERRFHIDHANRLGLSSRVGSSRTDGSSRHLSQSCTTRGHTSSGRLAVTPPVIGVPKPAYSPARSRG